MDAMTEAGNKMVRELAEMANAPLREQVLIEREKTHGAFTDVSTVSQMLKRTFRIELQHRTHLDVRHAEALDMIAVKLARIVCGNIHDPDHWLDLAGYAKLGMEACDRNKQ